MTVGSIQGCDQPFIRCMVTFPYSVCFCDAPPHSLRNSPSPALHKGATMTTQSKNDPRAIPSPRGVPLLGHTPQIPSTNPVEYFGELSKHFPEGLYGMKIADIEQIFVWDP